MSYDISAIRNRVNQMTKATNKAKSSEGPKLTYWKPQLGDNIVRFLPYAHAGGQPFHEIAFYNSRQLSERRMVAPFQFDKPDPIHKLMTDLRKVRQPEAVWNQMKELRVRESFYAPILVRGEEEKGVQIWEMSQRTVQSIYNILMSEDWADEDLFDLQEGRDFNIAARDSGRQFNGHVVKDLFPMPKAKPSPALKSKKACDELVASIPDLGEVFSGYCMSEERITATLNNFLNPDSDEDEDGTFVTADTDVDEQAESKISTAFADLDDA